jgi:hypothetical protein
MHLTTLQLTLWLAPTILEGVIVISILYRKLWGSLPIFFSYLIFTISGTCFLFLERGDPIKYFYAYWVKQALGSLAVLWVIKELFDNAFQQQLGLRQLGNVLFRWSIAVLLVVAVIVAFVSPGGDTSRIMAGIIAVKRTALSSPDYLAFCFCLLLPWDCAGNTTRMESASASASLELWNLRPLP